MKPSHAIACPVVALVASVCLGAMLLAAAPATEEAAAPIQIKLPQGWQAKTPPNDSIAQFAQHAALDACFELFTEPTEDFPTYVDLHRWAKLVKDGAAKRSPLAHRAETDLKETRIAGRTAVEYEVSGEAGDAKVHYRIIMLKIGESYCKLTCWTTPEHWEAAQGSFEELVKNLK